MKTVVQVLIARLILVGVSFSTATVFGQTIYIPSGTSGIGTSSNGNIGIKTSTPGSPLDVEQVGGGPYGIRIGRSDLGSVMDMFNDGMAHIESWNTGLWINGDANTNILMAGSGGFVGIATGSPNALLSLGGSAGIKQLVYDGNLNYNAGFGTNLIPAMNSLDIFCGYGTGSDTAINFDMPTGTWPFPSYSAKMTIRTNGYVGIGTTTPAYRLDVNGAVRAQGNSYVTGVVYAQEVIVEPQASWPDYVFSPNYHLAPLSTVEQTIKAQQHLPGMPSSSEVAVHGIKTGEMEAKLLEKVEELTLRLIAQEKSINTQKAELAAQRNNLGEQQARIRQLEQENAGVRSHAP